MIVLSTVRVGASLLICCQRFFLWHVGHHGLDYIRVTCKTKSCRDSFKKIRCHMSAPGLFVPILHMPNKYLYHLTRV
jgi:hypothetical protein